MSALVSLKESFLSWDHFCDLHIHGTLPSVSLLGPRVVGVGMELNILFHSERIDFRGLS